MSDISLQMIYDEVRLVGQRQQETAALAHQAAQNVAVLTERVENLSEKMDEHVEADTRVHERLATLCEGQSAKIGVLEKKHESLTAKLGTWAAIVAFCVTLLATVAKEAIAAAFRH